MNMPIISPEEAIAQGFVAITTPVSKHTEQDIILGMENTLGHIGVWIKVDKDLFEAARPLRSIIGSIGRGKSL